MEISASSYGDIRRSTTAWNLLPIPNRGEITVHASGYSIDYIRYTHGSGSYVLPCNIYSITEKHTA